MDMIKKDLTFIVLFSALLVASVFAWACMVKDFISIAGLLSCVLLAFYTGLKIGKIDW
jgi:hypothetical protein